MIKQKQVEGRNDIKDGRFKAEIAQFISAALSAGRFQQLVNLLNSNDVIEQHKGVIGIRRLLKDDLIEASMIDLGLIRIFMKYLKQKEYPQLKYEAAWIVRMLSAGNSGECACLMNQGIIGIAASLLPVKQNTDVLIHIVRCLSNIVVDSIEFKNLIMGLKLHQAIVKSIPKLNNLEYEATCMELFANICRSPQINIIQIYSSMLTQMLRYCQLHPLRDLSLTKNLCWTFSSLCNYFFSKYNDWQETKYFGFLTSILETQECGLASLNLVKKICLGQKRGIEILLRNGLLPALHRLLFTSNKKIRSIVCSILVNLTTHSNFVFDVVKQKRLMDLLFLLYEKDNSYQIKIRICSLIKNILSFYGQFQRARLFINVNKEKIFEVLYKNFESNNDKVLFRVLQITNIIFDFEEGLDGEYSLYLREICQAQKIDLRKLLQKSNNSIRRHTQVLIARYFMLNLDQQNIDE